MSDLLPNGNFSKRYLLSTLNVCRVSRNGSQEMGGDSRTDRKGPRSRDPVLVVLDHHNTQKCLC